MIHLDLFSGIGGFAYAIDQVWDNVEHIFCDNDKFCQQVLKKHWPNSKIYGDIKNLSVVDENDGKSIIEVCLQKNNYKQIEKTSKRQLRQQPNQRNEISVNDAEKKNGFSHVKLDVDESIVQKNADMKLCEEITPQMLTADYGWLEKIIRTGNTGTEEIEMTGIKKRQLLNGEEEFLREITIPVKIVDLSRQKKDNSMPTILKNGLNVQKKDLILKTEKHYVSIATKKYIGKIDIITAGTPCQPASQAGKRAGTKDDRWLWPETFRIIREAQPKFVILENVRGILTLESGLVFKSLLSEMENCGYETRAYIIPAVAVNAPHRRDRVWFVAYRTGAGLEGLRRKRQDEVFYTSDTKNKRCKRNRSARDGGAGFENESWNQNWLEVATELCGVDDGLSPELDFAGWSKARHRVERLKSLGNSIVPQVAIEVMKALATLSPK